MQDKKQLHFIFCFLPHIQFVLLALGMVGRGYYLLMPSLVLMVVVPLLDTLTGWQDGFQLHKSDFSRWQITLLDCNTRLYAVLHMALLLGLVANIARFTPLEIALLILPVSLATVIAFGASHELMHASEKFDHRLQHVATKFLFYPHYQFIHIRNHHVQVGTPQDENTAWLNESIYAYLLRTIPGSARKCWQIDAAQLASNGASPMQCLLKNQMLRYALGQVLLLLGLFWLGGGLGLLFFIAQAVFANILFEGVNYMQQYGLLRQAQAKGYEKTRARHSWDTYHFFSSYVTFRVGHHAAHHMAAKPYYLLGTEADARKLPVGYFLAIIAVFVPPWWRYLTTPILAMAGESPNAVE